MRVGSHPVAVALRTVVAADRHRVRGELPRRIRVTLGPPLRLQLRAVRPHVRDLRVGVGAPRDRQLGPAPRLAAERVAHDELRRLALPPHQRLRA